MHNNVIITVTLTFFIFGIFGCSTNATDHLEKDAPSIAPTRLPVDVTVVSFAPTDQEEVLAGSILPNHEVEIMSEVSKKLISVTFRDGSMVTKGQLLYKLDDADIRAKIRQLNAELQLARISERRFYELLKTEAVRKEEYDVALAKKQTLEASSDYLGTELAKTYIKAPFSGKIGISKVHTGSLVNAGDPLVTLQDQGKIKIEFTVSEKYLPLIKTGRTIRFSTELNKPLPATIVASEPGVDVQSRNITVQAVAQNPKGMLKPGMSAKIHFKTIDELAQSIVLPTQALVPNASGYTVFVVKGGVAKSTPVSIGNRNEEEAVITSGLQVGDTVMISNILRVMDGTLVEIINKK